MSEVKCGCGSQNGIHKLGNTKCYREIVPKDEEPKKFGTDKKLWKLPKQTPITDFTLKQQRGYSYHKTEDLWSKPKQRGRDWFEGRGWD